MDSININAILNREHHYNNIKDILTNFKNNKNDISIKKGLYIYGAPGSGKTIFVNKLLKDMNYDIINYNAGDVRNKNIIETITRHNMSDKNVISMFYKNIQYLAIVMDEIDGMNNGDKGGINSLIKIIRPKKTKKQRTEEYTINPIICISNYYSDKKIKELMKVCHVIELKPPTESQLDEILLKIMPDISLNMRKSIIKFSQGDLRKISSIYSIYNSNKHILDDIQNICALKSYNDNTRNVIYNIFSKKYDISEHMRIMNETDRTIIALLLHENIIDLLQNMPAEKSVPFYMNTLDNICFADYIDRITFQKQIWQFNEMSSLIKIFRNNKLLHDTFTPSDYMHNLPEISDIRFTKVLTKYSTEYNNSIFIQNLCQELSMDKKDMIAYFYNLRKHNSENNIDIFENTNITKLDITRIYKYIDKYTKENTEIEEQYIDEEEAVNLI